MSVQFLQDITVTGSITVGDSHFIGDNGKDDLLIESSSNESIIIDGDAGVEIHVNGSSKLFTNINGGITVNGDLSVTGDVLQRDIPFVINSNWQDDLSTTSYIYMPFNNNSDGTSNEYYNFFAAPAVGKVVSIMIMHVDGSMSSSFTTQIRVQKNGSADSTSGELTPSNGTSDGSYVEYAPGTTFAKGDRLQFAYQKSAGGKYWRGATATIIMELTSYDI